MTLSTAIAKRGILAIGLAAALALASAAFAQSTNNTTPAQQQNQQQNPPANPTTPQTSGSSSQGATPSMSMPSTPITPETPKVDPAEESAYKSFSDLKPEEGDKKAPHGGDADRDKQISLGEAFVAQYPLSKYDLQVYSQLVQDYYQKQQLDKMYSAADNALKLDPDDVTVLVLVGWVIPHSNNASDPEGSQRLDKAEQYEKHALEVLTNLPKPANLSDEQFAQVKAQAQSEAHSGLGLVYFRRQDPENSAKELQASTSSATSVDPTDYFVLGLDLMQLKRYSEAVDALQKCASVPSNLTSMCNARLATAKTAAANTPAAPKQ
jgi:tetratricopeptide (TPR) repeat protein